MKRNPGKLFKFLVPVEVRAASQRQAVRDVKSAVALVNCGTLGGPQFLEPVDAKKTISLDYNPAVKERMAR